MRSWCAQQKLEGERQLYLYGDALGGLVRPPSYRCYGLQGKGQKGIYQLPIVKPVEDLLVPCHAWASPAIEMVPEILVRFLHRGCFIRRQGSRQLCNLA